MKRAIPAVIVLMLTAAVASADVVVQRWGLYRHTQHKTVTWANAEGARTMTVDLSPVPAGTKVYRARLVFLAGSGYDVEAAGKNLALVEPYCLWFDATDAVQSWVAGNAGSGVFTVRGGGEYQPEDVYLEIAYEGKLTDKPRQVTGLNVFHRHGQTFLTWREIEDIAGGKEDVTWGEMVEKVRDCNPMVGIIPKWPKREIRYSVYRHDRPITAANLHEAQFIHDVAQGSVYAEDSIAKGRHGEHGPVYLKSGQVLRRVMLGKDEFLPPGTGYHWVQVPRSGKAYYAVVTSINGVENTADFSAANTAGPLDEKAGPPVPMLVAERITPVRGSEDAEFHERWYSYWCRAPLSAHPRRYDVVLYFCPQRLAKPAPLRIVRESWNYGPESRVQPEAIEHLILTHTLDLPIAFRMGMASFHYNLRSPEQAAWQPWPMRRQEALIEWLSREFEIDRNRVTVALGAWGMMEIEHPELYAMIQGYGQPEVTKGFQCWNRARGVWGDPGVYVGRPEAENPFVRSDFSRYVLQDPAKETPFFVMYPIRSAHLTEMGWPALPRFWRAMMDSKHPFVYNWQVEDRPTFRRDASVPAFANCSLDGNPGNGDLRQGMTFDTPINSWLTWEGETIVDEPDRWEMTLWLDDSAPLDRCTVDLTPRRLQRFKPRPGQRFRWNNTLVEGGRAVGSGTATADRWGLLTIEQLTVTKAKHRVAIR